MDTAAFVEAVEDGNRTELSRLGSSKSLYALTGGEMDEDNVFAVVEALATAQADRYESWAEHADGELADALSAAADAEGERAGDAAGKTDETVEGGVFGGLDDCEGAAERAGGLVAATIVTKKLQEQLVGFFVGQADPTTAQTFRSYGDELDERREAALSALDSVCTDDADWEAAVEAASGVVTAAYDVYVDRLEAMGVNPKPVC
ncbi:rubrerythrin family protein [Haloarchaeobius sp. FL176]|uniref:rubrerythrin family protein n=1 Tax=Haloarchaeobius sp. FL176 TaxID=2967129 RepID=UPI0021489235|nr:rubrerythrin family protein [Haloarchaeobius sp. FL176]